MEERLYFYYNIVVGSGGGALVEAPCQPLPRWVPLVMASSLWAFLSPLEKDNDWSSQEYTND